MMVDEEEWEGGKRVRHGRQHKSEGTVSKETVVRRNVTVFKGTVTGVKELYSMQRIGDSFEKYMTHMKNWQKRRERR